MSVVASRASWGPKYSNGATDNNGNSIIIGTKGWRDIYVHHSVTNVPGGANATVAQEQQHMRDLERIGETSFGQGISYTDLVFPSGRAYQGHDLDRRGAHTYQRNDSARAICYVDNFENDQPTDKAINTGCLILAEWRAAGLPYRITGGHRDVYATACPGKNLYAALNRITADGGSATQEDDLSAEAERQIGIIHDFVAVSAKAPNGQTVHDAVWASQRANEQGNAAILAAVAAIAKNTGVTPEQLRADMKAVVGEVNLKFLYDIEAVIREMLGHDNAEQADLVVDELTRRLNAGNNPPNGGL